VAELTQAQANALLAIEKHRTDDVSRVFPAMGGSLMLQLASVDGAEEFLLDINRKGRIKLSKVTYHARTQQAVGLARLDLDGPPHRNPDGVELPCPHLHLYREGYGLRWAYPVPSGTFTQLADLYQTCYDFMAYIRVTKMPLIDPILHL
jgi:Family of unknown function (DUF6978)